MKTEFWTTHLWKIILQFRKPSQNFLPLTAWRLTPLRDYSGFWWRHFSGQQNRVWEPAGGTFPDNITDLGSRWRHFSGQHHRLRGRCFSGFIRLTIHIGHVCMIICYHNTLSLIDVVYIMQFFGQLVTVKNVFVMVPIKMPVVLVEISEKD